MHREIDAAFGQRLFDFLGEHALGTDLRQSDVGNLVTGCLYDLELDFVSALAHEASARFSVTSRAAIATSV